MSRRGERGAFRRRLNHATAASCRSAGNTRPPARENESAAWSGREGRSSGVRRRRDAKDRAGGEAFDTLHGPSPASRPGRTERAVARHAGPLPAVRRRGACRALYRWRARHSPSAFLPGVSGAGAPAGPTVRTPATSARRGARRRSRGCAQRERGRHGAGPGGACAAGMDSPCMGIFFRSRTSVMDSVGHTAAGGPAREAGP